MAYSDTMADLLGKASVYFGEARPFLPMYSHLIISSILPIYAGAHASLSRPPSAAKPSKKTEEDADDEEEEEEEEEEEDDIQKMEGLSNTDAIVLPVTAGIVLAGLYFLIKKYGADMINFIMGWYFSIIGIFSVTRLINDMTTLAISLVFPTYYAHSGELWKIQVNQREAISEGGRQSQTKDSPLPGIFSRLPLPSWLKTGLWGIRRLLRQKFAIKAYIATVLDLQANVTIINTVAVLVGIGNALYVSLVNRPWFLTNLQGFAVSYCSLQLLSPTSFATGSLILSALFFYDIWAVFFTPLMVTVAQNLDQPIKLVFPRPDEPGETPDSPPVQSFGMLGLGDIVVPGIMIGLALRFDLYMFYLRKQKLANKIRTKSNADGNIQKAHYVSPKGHWGDKLWTLGLRGSSLPRSLDSGFNKPYFTAALIGYIAGMVGTIGIMSVFQHAQPALLYLVPAVLISLWGTALARGEIMEMWLFTEGVSGEQLEGQQIEEQRKTDNNTEVARLGLFQRLWHELFIESDKPEEVAETNQKSKTLDGSREPGKESSDHRSQADVKNLLFAFSVALHEPSAKVELQTKGKNPSARSPSRRNTAETSMAADKAEARKTAEQSTPRRSTRQSLRSRG